VSSRERALGYPDSRCKPFVSAALAAADSFWWALGTPLPSYLFDISLGRIVSSGE
jgi:hypothetical protein